MTEGVAVRAGRVATLLLAGAVLLGGCAPKASLDARWPRADAERTVPRPSRSVVWRLTGKPAIDQTSAASPAVMLPVSGAPAAALPGLDAADVVYEIAGGGQVRRLALFQSALPPAAGPMRQLTPPDRAVAAAYAASAAESPAAGGLLVDVASLAAAPASTAAGPPAMLFAAAPPPPKAGTVVNTLRIRLVPGGDVEWRYDMTAGRYQRFVGGKAAEGAAGIALRSTNVVVLWTAAGSGWPGATLAGSGRASVFLDGRKFTGSWEASGGPPVFRDPAGVLIPLLPGNSWIEVVDNGADIVVR